MPPPTALRHRLQRQLAKHGWRVYRSEVPAYTLFLKEVWELESRWPAHRRRILLEFWGEARSDPITQLTLRVPEAEEGEVVVLRNNWREQLPGVTTTLDRLRTGEEAPPEEDAVPMVLDRATWGEWAEPEGMVCLLTRHGWGDERTLRLLAAACCRRLFSVMQEARNARAVEAMEAHAEGRLSRRDMKKARRAARMAWLDSFDPALEALQALRLARRALPADAYAALAGVVREVFGDPWEVATLARQFRQTWRRWEAGTVPRLAETIAEEHSFDELPVLADALEDAGCGMESLLAHLRGPGEHVPGCWALGVVLSQTPPGPTVGK